MSKTVIRFVVSPSAVWVFLSLCFGSVTPPGEIDGGAAGAVPSIGLASRGVDAPVEPPDGKMPVLVLTDSQFAKNPFGGYLAEILRGEGLVAFEQLERSALAESSDPAARLAQYAVIILAEMELNPAEERSLRRYVADGGVLIAMRPDADLADLFGIRIGGPRPEGLLQYFMASPSADLVSGVFDQSLQYHGEATNYELDGASLLAHLCEDRDRPSSNPAVALHRHGGGAAVAFAFDLAKSVVLTRQGNLDWQNTEGDNLEGYRTVDMFRRPDGRTYFDLQRIAVPQADEQQRLLANLMLRLAAKPLPRMWYLPGRHKVLMISTGDGESNYGEEITPTLDVCASYGGRFSVYLTNWDGARGIDKTTVEQEAAWRAAGHEVGVHVFGGGKDGAGAFETLRKAYGKITGDLKTKFGHGARTARGHTNDWTGWVDMAAIEAEFGTGMDMNYCHFLANLSPLVATGYVTGSGLPQRLIDARGRLLPIYQEPPHWADQWFAESGITPQQIEQIFVRMFEAARRGYYSAFVVNIHPCRFMGYGGKDNITPVWPPKVWAYCRNQGIPMWSAEMLLDFVKARNQASFENLTWTSDANGDVRELSFDFSTPSPGQELTIMIPRAWSGRTLRSVTTDNKAEEAAIETIKGIDYAMLTTTRARLHVKAGYE